MAKDFHNPVCIIRYDDRLVCKRGANWLPIGRLECAGVVAVYVVRVLQKIACQHRNDIRIRGDDPGLYQFANAGQRGG